MATLLLCFEAALVKSYIPIGTFNGIARYLRVFVGRVIRSVWRRSTKDIRGGVPHALLPEILMAVLKLNSLKISCMPIVTEFLRMM